MKYFIVLLTGIVISCAPTGVKNPEELTPAESERLLLIEHRREQGDMTVTEEQMLKDEAEHEPLMEF